MKLTENERRKIEGIRQNLKYITCVFWTRDDYREFYREDVNSLLDLIENLLGNTKEEEIDGKDARQYYCS